MPRRASFLVPSPLALLAGCLPVIAHGPSVERGWSVGATASFSNVREDEAEGLDDVLFAPIGANGGYGWRPESDARPAFRVGLHVPVLVYALPQVDLYVQAPRRWFGDFQAGVGAATSAFSEAPYVQLGRLREDGTGWHLTHAWIDSHDVDLRPIWMTRAAYQFGARGGVTNQVFVAGGPTRGSESLCNDLECTTRDRKSWFVFAGFTFEKGFGKRAGRK